MVPGLHERAAQLRHRPVVSGAVRHLVGEQRQRFRPGCDGSSAGRRLCPARRPYAALRRGQERRQGTGDYWNLWYCASRFEIGRPQQAAVAVDLGVSKMTRIAMLGFALALLALAAGPAKADEQPKSVIAMASQTASAWSPVDFNFVAQANLGAPSRSIPDGLPKRRPPTPTSATTRT